MTLDEAPAQAITRRDLLKGAAALGVAGSMGGLLAACGPGSSASSQSSTGGGGSSAAPPAGSSSSAGTAGLDPSTNADLPIGVFAGVATDLVQSIVVPNFAKKYPNVKVQVITRGATDAYPKVKASLANPPETGGMWNDIWSARGTVEAIFGEFDDANVPNRADLIEELQPKEGSGITVAAQPYGIAYNPDLVAKPTSWLDLFKPEYKGKVALIDNFYDTFVMLAIINGKDATAAVEMVDLFAEHKENIGVFPNSLTQINELLDKGEVWLAPHWGGFALAAQLQGMKLAWSWPDEGATRADEIAHTIINVDPVRNTLTQQFLNEWLSPEFQLANLTKGGLSPASKAVDIPAEMAKYEGVITPDRLKEKKLFAYDYAWMGLNSTKIRDAIDQKLKV